MGGQHYNKRQKYDYIMKELNKNPNKNVVTKDNTVKCKTHILCEHFVGKRKERKLKCLLHSGYLTLKNTNDRNTYVLRYCENDGKGCPVLDILNRRKLNAKK